jgi:hypothetical protein
MIYLAHRFICRIIFNIFSILCAYLRNIYFNYFVLIKYWFETKYLFLILSNILNFLLLTNRSVCKKVIIPGISNFYSWHAKLFIFILNLLYRIKIKLKFYLYEFKYKLGEKTNINADTVVSAHQDFIHAACDCTHTFTWIPHSQSDTPSRICKHTKYILRTAKGHYNLSFVDVLGLIVPLHMFENRSILKIQYNLFNWLPIHLNTQILVYLNNFIFSLLYVYIMVHYIV